jgi:hypothetical protein
MKSASTPERCQPERSWKRIFVPSDFGEVIQKVPDQCPLVGGQAVAWWAQAYCPSDKPITSCDIDFWGFREDLNTLARALGQKPILPHHYEMTAWVGGIPMILKGEKTLVEFINTVPGLDVFNPEKASVRQLFSTGKQQKKLLVLSPVSLVLAKLHALRAFDQTERQDEQHLRVSLATANHFISQLLREAKIKQVLWNIERLIAASQNKPYQRLEAQHGFKVLSAIPIQQIREAASGDSLPEEDRNRLRNFQKLRWPQVEGRSPSAVSPDS